MCAASAAALHGATFAFPASYAQERLWFFDRMAPGSALYNSPLAFLLLGPLDAPALRASLGEVVHRHDALRTTFALRGGVLVQLVAERGAPRFDAIDLRALDPAAREEEAWRRAVGEARTPFDLGAGPLLRALLIRLGDDEHLLVLTIHHIAADGWSVRILFEELSALYGALTQGRASPLAPAAIQYPDYAVWQREWLDAGPLARQLDYWRARLAPPLPELELPYDRPGTGAGSFRGGTCELALPRALIAPLAALARAEGASLFMALLAALDLLLHRYTGHEDIRVGAPVAGRDRPEVERAVGFFANTVVFRTGCGGDPSFRALLRRVRATALSAYEHQDAPFQRVVEAVHPGRDAARTPLVQVMLALQPALEGALRFDGIAIQPLAIDTGTAKFDLQLELQETAHGLRGAVEYSADRFDAATVERFAGHFRTLLASIAAAPDAPLSALALLPDSERERIIVAWNDTSTPYPRDARVDRLFRERAALRPDAVAIQDGARTLTYGELRQRAGALASRLRAAGVRDGGIVAVLADRSLELVVAVVGILEAGAAYLPIDPSYPAERVALMLDDARAAALLARDERAARALRFAGPVLPLDGDGCGDPGGARASSDGALPDESAGPASGDGARLAYVMYTSGSTGRPKGVMVPHRAIARLVLRTSYVSLDASDVIAHVSNTSFDAATFEIWGALLNGARLVVLPRETVLDPAALAGAIATHGITAMFLTAALFNRMAREAPRAFVTMRWLIVGGEALDPSSVARVLREGAPAHFVNGYGPTECTTFAVTHLVREVPAGAARIPIGRPIANTRAYVLDAHGHALPVGVAGELHLGGDGVALGYLGRADLTAERFLPDPFAPGPDARMYRTGDRARWLSDGTIDCLGRLDRQVKLRGFRIEPEEIERALREQPAVRDAVVLAREDEPGDRRLVAYVTARDGGAPLDAGAVRAALARALPAFMVPAAIVPLDALPVSPNGKVDHAALPRPESRPREMPDARPRDSLELRLALLWERILHRAPIGIRDDFFDLGGHSLLAASLLAEVEREFGRALPLLTLFRAPTVEMLAAVLRDEGWTPPAGALVSLRQAAGRAPLVLVHRAGGHLLVYRSLALHLPAEQPVWGLQAPGHERGAPVHATVEAMAAHYVSELRAAWPEGPYYLGGSSFGGVVAFEMARRLHAMGERVALLALLDTFPTDAVRGTIGARSRTALLRLARRARNFAALAPREQLRRVLEGPASEFEMYEGPWGRAFSNPVIAALYRAFDAYRMREYPGRATLFRAADGVPRPDLPDDLGWRRWVLGGVEIVRVPGAHLSMLEEPHVAVLARRLAEAMAGEDATHI